MKTIFAALLLAAALTGCVTVKPGSPMLALTSSDTRAALAVLDQRSPEDIAKTEKLIARLEPGKAGYCLLSTGKPFVAIRNSGRQDQINIWMLDRAGSLANIATVTEYKGGHIYLHNPTMQPWRSWEEAKAHDLYDQLAAKLAANPDAAPTFGPWPPAGK